MMDLSPTEVDDAIIDVIGEVTNLVAGSFRSKLSESGHAGEISVLSDHRVRLRHDVCRGRDAHRLSL